MRKIKGKKFRGVYSSILTKRYLKKGIEYWAKDSYEQYKQVTALKSEIKKLTKELIECKKLQS